MGVHVASTWRPLVHASRHDVHHRGHEPAHRGRPPWRRLPTRPRRRRRRRDRRRRSSPSAEEPQGVARTSSERARRERRGVDRGGPRVCTILVRDAAPAGIRTRDIGTRASQRGGCALEQRVERPWGDRAKIDATQHQIELGVRGGGDRRGKTEELVPARVDGWGVGGGEGWASSVHRGGSSFGGGRRGRTMSSSLRRRQLGRIDTGASGVCRAPCRIVRRRRVRVAEPREVGVDVVLAPGVRRRRGRRTRAHRPLTTTTTFVGPFDVRCCFLFGFGSNAEGARSCLALFRARQTPPWRPGTTTTRRRAGSSGDVAARAPRGRHASSHRGGSSRRRGDRARRSPRSPTNLSSTATGNTSRMFGAPTQQPSAALPCGARRIASRARRTTSAASRRPLSGGRTSPPPPGSRRGIAQTCERTPGRFESASR